MYRDHPTIVFQITENIKGVLTQSQAGLTHLTFEDSTKGLLPVPPDLKCYDKSARSIKGDPLGHEMNVDRYSITLCTTNWYELYWKGELVTELNFNWNITNHYKDTSRKL